MIGLDQEDEPRGVDQRELIRRHQAAERRRQEEQRVTPEKVAERVRRLRQDPGRQPFQHLNWQ